jgi:hypothetical protein
MVSPGSPLAALIHSAPASCEMMLLNWKPKRKRICRAGPTARARCLLQMLCLLEDWMPGQSAKRLGRRPGDSQSARRLLYGSDRRRAPQRSRAADLRRFIGHRRIRRWV